MTQMKVARHHQISADQPLELGHAEKPSPGPKDVLVKVHACSVVPNTANMLKTSAPPGFNIAKSPIVFGLDVSGTIEQVGKHVLNLKVGDRVYVNPYLTCDTCQACRRERRDLCPAGALRGYFGYSDQGMETLERYPIGGMSEYLLSPDTNITVIPESIDLDTAARFGYIGTSYGALRKGGVGPASTVLINGVTGTLGYAAVAIALGFGATKILGIGRNPDRLKEVASLGSGKRIVVASSEEEKDLAEWVKTNTDGLGPDVLIDCLGVGGQAEITLNLIRSVKRGGKAILVAGGAEGQVSQSYMEAMMHDVAIIGSNWFTTGEMDDLVSMIDAGIIDFSFLEHKAFSLDEANEAIKFVGDRPGGAVNVLVKPGN